MLTKLLTNNGHVLVALSVLGIFGALLGVHAVTEGVAVPIMAGAAGVSLGAGASSTGTPKT